MTDDNHLASQGGVHLPIIVNPNIFRAYDIRGVVPEHLDERLMKVIGAAFGYFAKRTVAVAADVRTSGAALKEAFIQGCLDAGVDVHDLGILNMGAATFYGWQHGWDVAYITASHLPAEWNGVKFYHKDISYVEREVLAVRDITMRFVDNYAQLNAIRAKGKLKVEDSAVVLDEYRKFLLAKVKPERTLRVVIDCGNGSGSLIAPQIFREAGFDVIPVFSEPDGTFPNRNPDPLEDPLNVLQEKVVRMGADFGIAYDTDCDRLAIISDTAVALTPEQMAFVLLSKLLEDKKEQTIIANVECSRVIDKVVYKFWGNKLVRVPVGHTYLLEFAKKHNAIFGVEGSGHFVIPALMPFDDTVAISYYFACLVSRQQKKISEVVAEIPRFYWDRVNFACSDDKKFEIIERLKPEFAKKYPNTSTMDGVRVDFDNGWILIRASNTEPKIRLTVEAENHPEFERLKKDFSEILKVEIG